MINLAWNSNGRLARRAYKDATGGLSLSGLVILIGGAIAVLSLTKHNTYLSMAAVAAITAILLYIQYRYAQLSIRRLHDRGLPGWLYWPVMALGLAVIGSGAYVLMRALYDGGLFSFVSSLLGLMAPIVSVVLFKGVGLMGALALIAYNLFIAWHLGAEGRPGDNRYGPDPME